MEIISRPGNIFKNKDTHKKIVDMLKLVTKKGGTAEKAAVKGYETAGKTGTAQKLINGVYSDSQGFASFVGFVPADKPAFVLLVTADNPQPVHYGGLVAAPSFSHIAKKTLRFLNVPPEYEVPEDEEDDDL